MSTPMAKGLANVHPASRGGSQPPKDSQHLIRGPHLSCSRGVDEGHRRVRRDVRGAAFLGHSALLLVFQFGGLPHAYNGAKALVKGAVLPLVGGFPFPGRRGRPPRLGRVAVEREAFHGGWMWDIGWRSGIGGWRVGKNNASQKPFGLYWFVFLLIVYDQSKSDRTTTSEA